MNKINNPTITATLAAGSTATPYQYDVNITQRLCFPCCVSNTPVFAPAFSVASVNQVNTGLYMATIHVEGVISYVPCGGGCCDTKTQPLSADFNILITSTDAPTVTIAPGATINAITVAGCQSCGRTFVSETPLAVTVA